MNIRKRSAIMVLMQLTDAGQKVLILKRTKNSKWCYPGGKVDYIKKEGRFEGYEEAAVRECLEETGYQTYTFATLLGSDIYYADTNFIGKVFISSEIKKKSKIEFPNREHSEMKWVNVEELPLYFNKESDPINNSIAEVLSSYTL